MYNDMVMQPNTSTRTTKSFKYFPQIIFALFCALVFLMEFIKPLYMPIKYFIIPLLLILLFNKDLFDFILIPLTIYDGVIGMYISGKYSLIWFYLAALIVKILFIYKTKVRFKETHIFVLLPLVTYFIIFFFFGYGMASIKIIFIIFCIFIISQRVQKDTKYARNIPYVLLCSSIFNVIALVFGLTSTIEGVERQLGLGFSDPNYTSFVCILGLIVLMFDTYLVKHRIFSVLGVVLYILAIFTTGSRTGFILVLLIIMFKILLAKGIVAKFKFVLSALVIAIFCFFLILPYFSKSIDLLVERLVSTWRSLYAKNYAEATAGRSYIVKSYLDYFNRQGLHMQLFGGNLVGTSQLFEKVGVNHVTHNVYLDYILAFGIFGSVVFFGALMLSTVRYFKKYKSTNENTYLIISMIKVFSLITGIALAFLQVNLWWVIVII